MSDAVQCLRSVRHVIVRHNEVTPRAWVFLVIRLSAVTSVVSAIPAKRNWTALVDVATTSIASDTPPWRWLAVEKVVACHLG